MKVNNKIDKDNEVILSEGFVQQNIPYHMNIPFVRRVLVNNDIFPDSNMHIAVHHVSDDKNNTVNYCELHSHDVDEINLIIGDNNGEGLEYRVTAGDEEIIVKSPQSIFIPKGVKHKAEMLSGKGIFICIVMNGEIDQGK